MARFIEAVWQSQWSYFMPTLAHFALHLHKLPGLLVLNANYQNANFVRMIYSQVYRSDNRTSCNSE